MKILKKKKKQQTKKRKKHKKSVLQSKNGICFLCALRGDYRHHKVLHEHHIFGGANRPISEAEGLKVYLCIPHHVDGPEAVHNNADNMLLLRQIGQREYEKTHTREEFVEKFGKNYL